MNAEENVCRRNQNHDLTTPQIIVIQLPSRTRTGCTDMTVSLHCLFQTVHNHEVDEK